MGAYRYVITTKVIDIDWQHRDGTVRHDKAAVAIYAFKPYWSGWEAEKINRQMHFKYCQPWINAWKRLDGKLAKPSLVVIGDKDPQTKEITLNGVSGVYRVSAYSFLDDYTTSVGSVIQRQETQG